MAKRQPVHSSAAAVAIVQAAAKAVAVPVAVKLRTCDRPHWLAIIDAKPKIYWTPEKLTVAAQLARTIADIERIALLDDGTDDANILATLNATDKLIRREKGLRLMLDMKPAVEGDRDERERRDEIALGVERAAGIGPSSLLI